MMQESARSTIDSSYDDEMVQMEAADAMAFDAFNDAQSSMKLEDKFGF